MRDHGPRYQAGAPLSRGRKEARFLPSEPLGEDALRAFPRWPEGTATIPKPVEQQVVAELVSGHGCRPAQAEAMVRACAQHDQGAAGGLPGRVRDHLAYRGHGSGHGQGPHRLSHFDEALVNLAWHFTPTTRRDMMLTGGPCSLDFPGDLPPRLPWTSPRVCPEGVSKKGS